MAVKLAFVFAAMIAVAIAMVLPIPHQRTEAAAASQIPTMDVGKG